MAINLEFIQDWPELRKTNKVINVVYETMDWGQFKISELNREIKEPAIKKIMKSIEKTGQRQPILIDKDNVVFDGQHRLEACKRLNIPVKFIIDAFIEDETIQELNANQKVWTLLNHIEFFAKQGNANYIKLLDLKEKAPNVNMGLLAGMMAGKRDGGHLSELIKSGKFQAEHYEKVYWFLEDLKQMRKVCPTGKKPIDSFVWACWELWNIESFDLKRFLEKNRDLPQQARGVRDVAVMLAYILENYNKGFKSDGRVKYIYDEKRNIIITEKAKD